MVMTIVNDISSSLDRVNLEFLHFSDNGFIRVNLVLANDDAFLFVFGFVDVIPTTGSNLGNFIPCIWIDIQNVPEDIASLSGKDFGHLEIPRNNLLIKFAGVWVLEGQITTQHGINDDSARPNIDVHAFVFFTCDHLRGSVAGRSTSSFQFFAGLVLVGQSEVNNLNVLVGIEQQVLGLEITVDYSIFMNVLDPR